MNIFDWLCARFDPIPPNYDYLDKQLEHEKWLVEKAIEMKKLEIEALRLRAEQK
jgi:hypothetical protein